MALTRHPSGLNLMPRARMETVPDGAIRLTASRRATEGATVPVDSVAPTMFGEPDDRCVVTFSRPFG